MARSENSVSRPILAWGIQFDIHEFVHISENQHVAVQLHNPVILGERERSEFAPAVVKSCIIAIILVYRRQEVIDTLFRDLSKVKRFMALRGEVVGVEGDQRIFRSMLLE